MFRWVQVAGSDWGWVTATVVPQYYVFVQFVVEDDPQLQIQLVQMLVKYAGLRKASQWSLKYNVPSNQLPSGVWETQQNLPPHLQ